MELHGARSSLPYRPDEFGHIEPAHQCGDGDWPCLVASFSASRCMAAARRQGPGKVPQRISMLACVLEVEISLSLAAIEERFHRRLFLRSNLPWHHRPVRDSTRPAILGVLQLCGREAQIQVRMDIYMTVTTPRRLGTSAGGHRAVRATWPAGLTDSDASRQPSGGKNGAIGDRRTVRVLRQASGGTLRRTRCRPKNASRTRRQRREWPGGQQRYHVLGGKTC